MATHVSSTDTRAYGLMEPSLPEAYAALRAVFGAPAADDKWRDLLAAAGLDGSETTADALARIVDAMRSADPVTALCARALTIRAESYARLAANHDTLRSNQ